jgi:Ca-activated chloride channel family protein
MNISKITPDDPRLTAYALGELEPEEHAAIEAAIKGDPAAQAAVAQIRALGNDLSAALAKEPLPVATAPEEKPASPPAREAYQPRKFIRFPYYLLGGLAAACLAVIIASQQRQAARERVQLADARANAKFEKETAQENAKLEDRSRTLYEIDLKNDADNARVASMPVAKPESAPSAPEPVPAAAPTNALAVNDALVAGASVETKSMAAGQPAELPKGTEVVVDSESIQLAPFMVEADKTGGYQAKNTLAGTRLKTNMPGGAASLTMARKRGDENSAALRGEAERRISPQQAFNTEAYAYQADNDYLDVAGNPLSTFSIDVDTASYANMRRFLKDGQHPPRDAVRIEELVNYFPYHYAQPKDKTPFAASMEVASAPWAPTHRLVRIGLKGREIPATERPALNLVFLLDVSGSMNEPNKLPLVKESMRLLVEKLKPTDRVAIAVYAGASGLALPSTPASKKQEILSALDELHAGGSTNGAMGIQLAYDIAKANFIAGGANRVVLCTDGDFNIGVTNQGDLTRLIEEKAKSGVFLTVLGFGMGNYKDSTLQKLADTGNGNYGYVDNAAEAKKLLADQLSGTLVTIAKDVKLQVEFNPARVKSYRLIGYEKRLLKKEDFNNDKIDAGEIGAGHTVTALYEVVPVDADSSDETPAVDPLRYQAAEKNERVRTNHSPEMLTLKIRYKAPTSDVSSKLEFPLVDSGATFEAASQDFKFAAAVASFGMMLRESPHKGVVTFDSVLGWAEDGLGDDAGGYRHEFMDLVKIARACSG